MKVSYIQNTTNLKSTETRMTYKLIDILRERGIDVLVNDCTDDCDFILSMNGMSQMEIVMYFREMFPNIKSIMYVWDCYPWTHYFVNYPDIVTFDKVWTPSNEVILRLQEAYGINPNKCEVLKCYAEFFEVIQKESEFQLHQENAIDQVDEVISHDFLCHFVRGYDDPNYGMTNDVCDELGIRFIRSEHGFPREWYKKAVLDSKFLITEYMEASTGGLTLLEGYYHGKNVLVSDSIYMGARDYFGDRAYYFKDGDREDLKRMIEYLWNLEYTPDLKERREWCKQYTIDAMVDRIINGLEKML